MKPEQLLRRAKEAHAATYLTLISIVQGVAFSFFSFFIVTNFSDFNFANWLLILVTFTVIIVTWNEYVMSVIAFQWVPDLKDAAIPFLLGASQVFLVQCLNDPELWFFGMFIFCVVGTLGFKNMYGKAKQEKGDNEATLSALGQHVIVSELYPSISAVIFLCFVLIMQEYGPSQLLALILSGLSTAMMAGFLIRSLLYWKAFVGYVQADSEDPA